MLRSKGCFFAAVQHCWDFVRCAGEMKELMQHTTVEQAALSALLNAIKDSDVDAVKQLTTQHSAVLRSGQAHNQSGRLPLQYAASLGDQLSCRVLLDGGAPLEQVDAKGRTPLMARCHLPVPVFFFRPVMQAAMQH
jgi:hypothetical protein